MELVEVLSRIQERIFDSRQRRPFFAVIALVLWMLIVLPACSPNGEKLFADDCEQENANCKDPQLILNTLGAQSDITNTPVASGDSIAGVMLKPVRKGETSSVQFTIRNTSLVPLRSFTLRSEPGGLSTNTSATDDCSAKILLLYNQTCSVTLDFAPGEVVPDQALYFEFLSLLGAPITFSTSLGGSTIMAEFGISEATAFSDQEVVFDPTNTNGPFYEREFTVINEGSADAISAMDFYLSGSHSDEYSIITGGVDACAQGQTLAANGGSCTLRVRFKPTSEGLKSAHLILTGAGGYARAYELDGKAISLQPSVEYVDFGSHSLSDGPIDKIVYVSHPGSGTSPAAQNCTYSVSGNHFSLYDNTCSASVEAGSTCALTIRLTPQSVSTWHHGTLEVNCDERGEDWTLELTGQSVVSHLTVDATALDFGEVLVGSTSTASLNLTNSSPTTANNLQTQLDEITGEGLSITSSTCSQNIGSNETCAIQITFSPLSNQTTTAAFNAITDEMRIENPTFIRAQPISVVASETTYDFGSLMSGSDRVGPTLRFINPSESQTAAGCTLDTSLLEDQGFSLDEGSTCTATTELAPGQSCSIEPRFTSSDRANSRLANLTFACSVGGTASINLKAEVIDDLRLLVRAPSTLEFLDRLVGISVTDSIIVANASLSQNITDLSVSAPGIEQPWSNSSAGAQDCSNFTQLNSGQKCEIQFTYAPLATYESEQTGSTNGSVSIQAESGNVGPTDSSYSGSATKIIASTTTYNFGIVPSGEVADSTIIVVQNPSSVDEAAGCALETSTEFTTQWTTCEATLGPRKNCYFRVRLLAQANSVNLTGYARVSCAVGGRAKVNLSAAVKRPPTLQWSGPNDFGDVDLGSSVSANLTLTHIGDPLDAPTSNLNIALTDILPSGFSLAQPNDCPAILNQGQSCTVPVTFTPITAGVASDTLRANDPGETEDLLLSGRGIDTSTRAVPSVTSVNLNGRLIGVSAYDDISITNSSAAGDTAGLTITNPSSGAPWSLGTSPSPCGGTLLNGASCQTRLVYTPTVTGTSSGTLTISASNMSPSQIINYAGTAVKIGASQASLDFGVVDLNLDSVHPTTIIFSNPSSIDTASGCSLNIGSNYEAVASDCGSTIAPGGSCSTGVKLQAQSTPGTVSSQMIMSCSVGGSIAVNLLAEVRDIPNLVLSANTNTDFGDVDTEGDTSIRVFTLTNYETSPVSLTDIGVRPSSVGFSIQPSGTTCSASTTLAATGNLGSSCTLSVIFDPDVVGEASANLYASVNSPSPYDYELSITGNGTTVQLIADIEQIDFSPREVGQSGSEIQTVTITNAGTRMANLSYSTLSAPFSSLSSCGAVLMGGASCTIDFSISAHSSAAVHSSTFTVTDTYAGLTKDVSIQLNGETKAAPLMRIADNIGNSASASLALSDVTGSVTSDRAIFDLNPAYREVTYEISNTAVSSSNLIIQSISLNQKSSGGGTAGTMSLLDDTCTGATLTNITPCTFKVRYTPTSNSEESHFELSALALSEISGESHSVEVITITGRSRRGAVLTSTATTYQFNPILVSTTANSTVIKLSNDSDQDATSLSYSFNGTDSANFTKHASSTCGSSLASGAECDLVIQFSPGTPTTTFSASLDISGAESSANLSINLKAASYRNDVVGSNHEGHVADITADSTRLYMVSRRRDTVNNTNNFRPLLTLCSRSPDGVVDMNDCTQTDIAKDFFSAAENSNFAGSENSSPPRIAIWEDKIFLAVQNKDELLGGDSTGGTSTVVVCLKPTTGNSILDCNYLVVNNTLKSGQAPSLVVTANKIVLANMGENKNLIVTACEYDVSQATAAGTTSSIDCDSIDFADSIRFSTSNIDEGWNPSLAFDGDRFVVATTHKITNAEGVGESYLRINACNLTYESGFHTFNNCTSEFADVDPDNNQEGRYPALVMSGSKLYIAHQLNESQDQAYLRLSSCDISSSNTINAPCDVQTVSTNIASGITPKISASNNNLWISSTVIHDLIADPERAAIEVHRCELPIGPTTCSSTPAYVRQAQPEGPLVIFSWSHFLDAANRILIAPFSATGTTYTRRKGLFQVGLWPEP